MPAPYAIFCADPIEAKTAESDFQLEVTVARAEGFTPILIDHDELDQRNNPAAALRKSRIDEPGMAVYRGWMLRAEAYASLFEALLDRGVRLLTSPADYAACHHGPGSYAPLAEWMPKTNWVREPELDNLDSIRAALGEFGPSPVIIKDWVKSQASGYWNEACFIPDASHEQQARQVISRFRELQESSLVGGIVFKSYLPLLPLGSPPDEHRAFIVGNEVVGCWPRSEQARSNGSPPIGLLRAIAAKVPSPFASADFGKDEAGRWWLLEVGDGQVSGLPNPDAAGPMFKALAEQLKRLGDA